jgi:hypothetical protein
VQVVTLMVLAFWLPIRTARRTVLPNVPPTRELTLSSDLFAYPGHLNTLDPLPLVIVLVDGRGDERKG